MAELFGPGDRVRPDGTEGLTGQALAALVTRNGLIGVAPV